MSAGILLVDKPQGPTSHDVVARVRRLAGTRRVGHAGTLDPMATGLLIIGVDAATRLLTYLVGADKEYEATIRLGSATTTDDAEGETVSAADSAALAAVTDEAVALGVAQLTGDVLQRPSSVSAIKVDGRRAYDRVRAGEEVELDARPVTVYDFEVLDVERSATAVDLEVKVVCSSGTYIRALARDLGAGLGVGGHLTRLRRTRVGPFAVGAAHDLETLDAVRDALTPAEAAGAVFPRLELDAQQAVDLGHGKRIGVDGQADGDYAAIAADGRLVALVAVAGGIARVTTGFPVEAGA